MSQPDADVEQPSRAELARRLQATENRLDAMSKKFEALKQLLIADRELTEPEVEAADDVLTRLADVEESVDEYGGTVAMFEAEDESLDTEQRIARIRKYLVESAAENDVNIYKADYREVRAIFDGAISESWASQLLKKAAGTFPEDADDAKEGFYVDDGGDTRTKIAVQTDKIEDRRLLRLKNSDGGATPP